MTEPLLVVDGLGMTYGADGRRRTRRSRRSRWRCGRASSSASSARPVRQDDDAALPVRSDEPDQRRGRRLLGKPVTKPPRAMALVFQDYSRSLLPWLDLLHNVAMPLKAQGASEGGTQPTGHRGAGVGGSRRATCSKYPWQLSGGMQQRTAIARALAYQPEILLMDEPFASVDAQTRAELEDLLLRCGRRYRHHRAARHPRHRRGGLPRRPHRRAVGGTDDGARDVDRAAGAATRPDHHQGRARSSPTCGPTCSPRSRRARRRRRRPRHPHRRWS